MSQQPDSDLQAELAALRQRLSDLEVEHRELLHRTAHSERSGLSRKFLLGALPMLLLVVTGGLLYGQGGGDPLFIHPNGNVGIGTIEPKETLDVAGTLNVTKNATLSNTTIKGSLTTTDNGNVEIGVMSSKARLDVSGKADTEEQVSLQLRSGNTANNYKSNQITFGYNNTAEYRHAIKTRHHGGRVMGNAIDFYVWKYDDKKDTSAIGGLHTMTLNGGNVGIGTTDPEARLDVHGDARIRGTVRSLGRYQRDDQAETTYEISPRYHLSLTASQYAGRTKTIPQDVIADLCGDQDGCEFRLGMTRWYSDKATETASRSGLFYYSKTDGHWRASSGEATALKADKGWKPERDFTGDLAGIDGDGKIEHVRHIWVACYFTDGTYGNYIAQGDKDKGMQLLVWNGYSDENRTCELTLID